MESLISPIINKAELSSSVLSLEDFQIISKSLKNSLDRFNSAEKLSGNINKFSKKALDFVYDKGNFPQNNKDKCARDINHYLRLVNYCLITGSKGPLEEWGLEGMREVIRIQNLPTLAYIDAFTFIRDDLLEAANFSEQGLKDIKELLDYLISSLA